MLAYLNDEKIKKDAIAKMAAHRKADELIQGYGYWKDGKGCAVGCLVEGSDHSKYESKFGIPQMLAHLEDKIFEGLPKTEARKWPERFLKSIKVGSDLSLVGWKFLHWNLTVNIELQNSDDKDVQKSIIECRNAIKQVATAIAPLTKGKKPNIIKLDKARSAAWAAESAARSAARSAAWAARSAAWAAESAARSAAWAAESAAWAAESAESAAWSKMADKLIELIEQERQTP